MPSPCAIETCTEIEVLCRNRDDIIRIKECTSFGDKMEKALTELLLAWNQDREIDKLSLDPEARYLKLIETHPVVIQQVALKHIASYLGIHQNSLSLIRKKTHQENLTLVRFSGSCKGYFGHDKFYIMAKYFILINLLLASLVSKEQIIKDTSKPTFEWIIPVIDFPFIHDAAQAEANRRMDATAASHVKIKVSDYANFYRNLNMDNITDISGNLHGTLYYVNNLV